MHFELMQALQACCFSCTMSCLSRDTLHSAAASIVQASPGAVHASMAAGADHHLTKPYTREQLLQAIEATCAEQRRPSDA